MVKGSSQRSSFGSHTAVRWGAGGNRLAGARLRLEFLNDLAQLGESARFVLGEHKFAIYENVEDTVAPRDQPRLYAKRVAQFSRQTGGRGLIVSRCAIMDFNFHKLPPSVTLLSAKLPLQ